MMRRIGSLIERRRECSLPVRARRRVAIAAIDERVAVVFLDQPQVHVVERERQRHSQPEHARARFRRVSAGQRRLVGDFAKADSGRVAVSCTLWYRAAAAPPTPSPAPITFRHSHARLEPQRRRAAIARDVLDLRSRARVRADDARDPLLRGLRACSRRDATKRTRVYGERERVRLKLILRGKRLGLALSEIGELLDLYEVRRNERAQLTAFLALLAERRTRLLQQREDIEIVLAEIDGIERECRRRLQDGSEGRTQIDVYVNVMENSTMETTPGRTRRCAARSAGASRRLDPEPWPAFVPPFDGYAERVRDELRAAGRDGADRRGIDRRSRRGTARSRSRRARNCRSSTATCMRVFWRRWSIRRAATRATRCSRRTVRC